MATALSRRARLADASLRALGRHRCSAIDSISKPFHGEGPARPRTFEPATRARYHANMGAVDPIHQQANLDIGLRAFYAFDRGYAPAGPNSTERSVVTPNIDGG